MLQHFRAQSVAELPHCPSHCGCRTHLRDVCGHEVGGICGCLLVECADMGEHWGDGIPICKQDRLSDGSFWLF